MLRPSRCSESPIQYVSLTMPSTLLRLPRGQQCEHIARYEQKVKAFLSEEKRTKEVDLVLITRKQTGYIANVL